MINGGSLSSTSSPALSNTTAAQLCVVPPGVNTVIISNVSGQIVYVTAGATATTSNGFAIANDTVVTIPTQPGSAGTTLSVIAAAAPTGPVSWLISNAQ